MLSSLKQRFPVNRILFYLKDLQNNKLNENFVKGNEQNLECKQMIQSIEKTKNNTFLFKTKARKWKKMSKLSKANYIFSRGHTKIPNIVWNNWKVIY